MGLSCVGVAFCLICLVITFWHKSVPVFKINQPLFLMVSMLGGMILCFANYFNIGENTDARCMSRIFAFNMGFTVMFAPLFAKTYRIVKILNNKKLKKVNLSASKIFSVVSVVVTLEIILMIIWR